MQTSYLPVDLTLHAYGTRSRMTRVQETHPEEQGEAALEPLAEDQPQKENG